MIKEEFSMRDIDAFLNSLVNIDRNSLVAILSSEVAAARQVVNCARQRTASQRAKRQRAEQRAARQERKEQHDGDRQQDHLHAQAASATIHDEDAPWR